MTFQQRVDAWLTICLPHQRQDVTTRSFRFIEEAIELVQSAGLSREDVMRVVEWVYSRPPGVAAQEVGGTTTTLAALCTALGLSMEVEAAMELTRISTPEVIEKIRRRQATKDEVTKG